MDMASMDMASILRLSFVPVSLSSNDFVSACSTPIVKNNSSAAVFKLGTRIGSGGYGAVYQATTDVEGGPAVALKKSRVSRKVKRTHLLHEARVIQLLQGHSAVPKIYGHGQLEHFEYLAMELLGPSLADLHKEQRVPSLKTILIIVDQMLSALTHIHAAGIIHSDIKPDNVLISLGQPHMIRLIDFGIARQCRSGEPSTHDPLERGYIVGTPIWASLNAHYGLDLSRRDDLESLAYTLLFLLRGNLPWRRHSDRSSTLFGSMAQVREKKRAWPGSRLAKGLPIPFGQLLDYARSLDFDQQPDYDGWRFIFRDLSRQSGFEDDGILHWSISGDRGWGAPEPAPDLSETPIPPRIVEPGQLVYVQVLARTTVEGYSSQSGDLSYWHDPDLSTDYWLTTPRPAIVLETSLNGNKFRRDYMIKVIPLRRRCPTDTCADVVSISTKQLNAVNTITTAPDWPQDNTLCYTFHDMVTFVPVPDETEAVPAHWKISEDDVEFLLTKFSRQQPDVSQAEPSLDSDALDDARMRKRFNFMDYAIYVKFTPLDPSTFEKTSDGINVDWDGKRGWFDELVKINKRRSADAGWAWTATGVQLKDQTLNNDLSDSYFAWDIADWEIQRERDRSLTLGTTEEERLDEMIEKITQIL